MLVMLRVQGNHTPIQKAMSTSEPDSLGSSSSSATLSWVALDKTFHLPGPQFPHLSNREMREEGIRQKAATRIK